MRTFNFDEAVFQRRSPERQKYYRDNFDKPITEEEFVAAVESWPKKALHNRQSRGPSASRHEYKVLVTKYGFFPGGQNG